LSETCRGPRDQQLSRIWALAGCYPIVLRVTITSVNRVPDQCGPGSQSELIDGVGHFMMVQRPTDINKRILEFLAA
jgi:pimeloyl-ACP methyl ester carboxylesterase